MMRTTLATLSLGLLSILVGAPAAEPLVDYPSSPLFPFGTGAIAVGDEIRLGGIGGGQRIARFPRP